MNQSISLLLLKFIDVNLQGLLKFLTAITKLAPVWLHASSVEALTLAFIAVLLVISPRGLSRRYLAVFLLLPLFFPKTSAPRNDSVDFWVLDVGQGLATVLRTKHHTLVYDTGAGHDLQHNMGRSVLQPFFLNQHIKQLDTLIVSHADNDHIGGAGGLLSMYPAKHIYTSAPKAMERIITSLKTIDTSSSATTSHSPFSTFSSSSSAKAEDLEKYITSTGLSASAPLRPFLTNLEHNTQSFGGQADNDDRETVALKKINNIKLCTAGLHWRWDGVSFTFLYPSQELLKSHNLSRNNLSCVLQVKLDDQAILLTGDIEQPAEQSLLARYSKLHSQILLVPHHGSHTSSTPSFIKAVAPASALISAGLHNRYHLPSAKILRRYQDFGSKIYNTARCGAIILRLHRGHKAQILCYRQQHPRFWSQLG